MVSFRTKIACALGSLIVAVGFAASGVSAAIADSTEAAPSATEPFETAVKVDSTCRADEYDPFDFGYKITSLSKKFSDMCVNSKRFRPPMVISANASGDYVIANFLHKDRFFTATFHLDESALESILMQTVIFNKLGPLRSSHTQVRAKFKDPAAVILTAQDLTGDIETTGSLEFTYEAAMPVDTGFKVITGMKRNYPLIGRMTTVEQRLRDDAKLNIHQYPLALMPEEQALFVKMLIDHSATISMNGFYQLLRPNCVTEIFDMLDQLPSLKGRFKPFRLAVNNDPVINPMKIALRKRGLLMPQGPTLQEEFGQPGGKN